MVEDLDRNLFHYGKFLEDKFRKSIINQPGSGAAGGLAASLMALFDIKIKSGFDILCDLTGFEEKVKEADLIITGEGRIDRQTYYGKTTFGVLKLGYKYKRPVIAITGNAEDSNPPDIPLRFSAIIPIIEKPCTYDFALANTSRLITITAERIINLISSV